MHHRRPGWPVRRGAPTGRAAAWSGLLVRVLVLALCVYTVSGSLLRVLGPVHWHTQTAAHPVAMPPLSAAGAPVSAALRQGLAELRRLGGAWHAHGHGHGHGHVHGDAHAHAHAAVQRHVHRLQEAGVRHLGPSQAGGQDGLTDLSAAASVGAATLLLALAPASAWALRPVANGRWPVCRAAAWRNAPRRPLLRPPQAV